jgi:hypothetical protein
VTNAGLLEMDARETINGNFSQARSGSFESLIADDNAGGYGALAVSGLATRNGTSRSTWRTGSRSARARVSIL